jgi:hypothetical protein
MLRMSKHSFRPVTLWHRRAGDRRPVRGTQLLNPDAAEHPLLREALGVAHRQVLGYRSRCDAPGGDAGVAPIVNRLLKRTKDNVRPQRRGDAPVLNDRKRRTNRKLNVGLQSREPANAAFRIDAVMTSFAEALVSEM